MPINVIYIPGLGDSMPRGQSIVLKIWRIFGLKVHYLALGWADKEDFAPKLEILLSKIDHLAKDGQKVSLVGVSAGASAVLNAYVRTDKVASVVYICGKINNAQSIHQSTYTKNPAFEQSLQMLKDTLPKLKKADLGKIMSVVPLADSTVPVIDTKIAGTKELIIPTRGHLVGIAYAILFKGRAISRFIRKKVN